MLEHIAVLKFEWALKIEKLILFVRKINWMEETIMVFSQRLLILFIMIFCHLIDDYKLQGILANMKQRQWWKENADKYLYRNDYKMALIEHAFSWSFTTTLPFLVIAFTQNNSLLAVLLVINYIINTAIHAFVDDLKANKFKINLIEDQLAHLLQIICTWIILMAAI